MHDDVIDLSAWHCICNGIATPGLARALAQATGNYVANHRNNIYSICTPLYILQDLPQMAI